MRKFVAVCGIILVLLLVFSGTVAAAPPEKVDVIIGFDRTPGPSEEGLVRGCGGEIKYTYNIIPAIAASVPETAIQGLLRNPRVTGIVPNIIFHAIGDGEYSWGVLQIGADIVHDSGNQGSGIKVAVIDTGIDYRHPELRAAYAGGYDFVNGDPNPMDDNGHGTHVAGTIAAALNNSGVVGVAPGVELYALKVLDRNGSGYLWDIIAALNWACGDNPENIVVQITNNSYGSPVDDTSGFLQSAFDLSYSNPWEDWNLLHVAAAGNSGITDETVDNVEFPAKYNSVIAVAATDQGNNRAYFPSIKKYSSTGEAVELAAPGIDILSTYLHRSYAWGSGTSMACPHVVGTAALVMASPETVSRDLNGDDTYEINGDGTWSNIEVRALLQATADDLGTTGKDNIYGYGLVDADEAASLPAGTNSPPVADAGGPYAGTTNIAITFDGSGSNDPDGDPLTYAWNFGDGSTGTGVNPTHVYTSGGTYFVTLVVNDGEMNSEPSTTEAVISEAPNGVLVEQIQPNNVDEGGSTLVTISGSGFQSGATVILQGGEGPTPKVSEILVVDSNTITATISTKSGGPPRARYWDVRVTNPDTSTGVLPDGFIVMPK